MLHIILMILKILGILILSILGLGLCIGLLILLCPIRYYLEGSIYGKPEGRIRISWLLRLVCATVSYKENRAEYRICIFGIRLKKRKKKEEETDSEYIDEEKGKLRFWKRRRKNPRIEKKKAEKEGKQAAEWKEKKQEVTKLQQTDKKGNIQQTEENEREETGLQQSEANKEETETHQAEIKEKVQQTETNKKEEDIQQVNIEQEEIKIPQKETAKKAEQESEERVEGSVQQKEADKESSVKVKNALIKIESILTKIKNILIKIKDIPVKTRNILIKITSIPAKIKGILTKIKDTLSVLKANLKKFLVLLRDLNKKKQTVLAFIKDEKNREAFRHTKGKLFQLLCHVLPGKTTLKLHYGFEDPATTGMLTGMIFMFYPKSAEQFQLTPDFENRVLEGELTIKGRVQLIRVLWILFSIYSHKECNRIIKMALKKLRMR